MIPITQSIITNREDGVRGDCLRACICSLLEISDINKVPHFVEQEEWLDALINYLYDKGYLLYFDKYPPNIKHYMVWGLSPRGFRHSVIHSNGKLVHDPHPDGGDVVPDSYVWVVVRREEYNSDIRNMWSKMGEIEYDTLGNE